MQVRHMPNEHGHSSRRTLFDLPVELIEEIYVLALSPAFPQTCKCIHSTIKSFSPFAHAYYILGRHPLIGPSWAYLTIKVSVTLSSALLYPITTLAVLEALCRIILRSNSTFKRKKWVSIKLPKRIFRSLGESDMTRNVNSYPLPILRFLWGKGTVNFKLPVPDLWELGDYPLVCAVQFLLSHGAQLGWGDSLIKVAISKKNLKLVKILVKVLVKRGDLETRWNGVRVKQSFVNEAIKYDAQDIVKYFKEERGISVFKTLRNRTSFFNVRTTTTVKSY